jgi:hypothetical protein
MTRGRRRINWRTLRHRLLAALSLVGYLAAAIGYPLPAASAGRKDYSQPFPCQGHLCGCQSAEECWSGCCCLSPEERWAWAREHHVQPPEYAEKPAAVGWRSVRLRDRERPDTQVRRACAASSSRQCPSPASCCSKCAAAASRSSCCDPTARGNRKVNDAESKSGTDFRWGLSVSALHCKGLSMSWVQCGVVLPSGMAARVPERLLPEQAVQLDDLPASVTQSPPAPPPRSLSS